MIRWELLNYFVSRRQAHNNFLMITTCLLILLFFLNSCELPDTSGSQTYEPPPPKAGGEPDPSMVRK